MWESRLMTTLKVIADYQWKISTKTFDGDRVIESLEFCDIRDLVMSFRHLGVIRLFSLEFRTANVCENCFPYTDLLWLESESHNSNFS